MATVSLTEQFTALSTNEHLPQPQSSPQSPSQTRSPQPTMSSSSQHNRESVSSMSSIFPSEDSSSRLRHSPLRRLGALPVTDEIESVSADMSAIHDKIFEIEELRHNPTERSAHASQLDTLLSQVNDWIDALAPQIDALPPNTELVYLKKDWGRILAQQVSLKQEMLEDPWLIRFRTTADQADAMMDPLNNSLVELTNYVGRMLSSISVPMRVQDGRLSIEKLCDLAESHKRLKAAYVPSVQKILHMMGKSIADRPATNGEALRRLNDMTTRWESLQRQLAFLDDKVDLVFKQNRLDLGRPEPEQDNVVEMLDESFSSAASSYLRPVPKLGPSMPSSYTVNDLHRLAGGYPSSKSVTGTPTRSEAATPHRTLRRASSRSNLSSASGPTSDRPRWNASTKVPDGHTPRRPSQASSVGHGETPRRPASPAFSSPSDPSRSRAAAGPRTPMTPSRPALGTRTLSGGTPNRLTSSTSMMSISGRLSLPSSTPSRAGAPSSLGRSLAPARAPSSWGARSPAPMTPSRASSRMSANLTHIELKPFVPSKYDLLDMEVQKVLDAVKPGVFIARVDHPLRRGQRKGDGEMWTGEYVFGAGSRSTPVKYVEIGSRVAKRGKCMVKAGGAWLDLMPYLEKKRDEAMAEQDEEILDDD